MDRRVYVLQMSFVILALLAGCLLCVAADVQAAFGFVALGFGLYGLFWLLGLYGQEARDDFVTQLASGPERFDVRACLEYCADRRFLAVIAVILCYGVFDSAMLILAAEPAVMAEIQVYFELAGLGAVPGLDPLWQGFVGRVLFYCIVLFCFCLSYWLGRTRVSVRVYLVLFVGFLLVGAGLVMAGVGSIAGLFVFAFCICGMGLARFYKPKEKAYRLY